MRPFLFFLPLVISGCAPLSPEQRANIAYQLQAGAQRQAEINRQYAQDVTQVFQNRPMYQPAQTYYMRPDPLWPGGTVISPNRY